MLRDLLRAPGVEETCVLRSPLGFMAYHGGDLEKVTDVVAAEAAAQSGCSYYAVTQSQDPLRHIPSAEINPEHSPALSDYIDHVDEVITIHGYGRETLRRSLLLGGQNRELAAHLADDLRAALPRYDIIDDHDFIPPELAGLHPDNPVNLPRNQGVQIELPPVVRWHMEGWHWSDRGDAGRAPDTQTLIDALAVSAIRWMAS